MNRFISGIERAFARKPLATPFQAGDIRWGFLTPHMHNLITQESRVLRSYFYVRVHTQASDCLCGNLVCALWGICTLLRRGSHSLHNRNSDWITVDNLRHRKLWEFIVLQHPAVSRVVRWISATSSAFFTVSHQNGFSSSIQSASNLCLVRIRYLYADSVLNAVYADFLRSEGLG